MARATPPRKGTPGGRLNSRERRDRRRALERAIEAASTERRTVRAEGRAQDAYRLDVELLGADRGQGPNARVGRGRERAGAFDPYVQSPADGLLAQKREVAPKTYQRVKTHDDGAGYIDLSPQPLPRRESK